MKSDFVLSFCELVMGGKTGLEAIERTVIDRAVKAIYRPYLANPCPENMPILSDLHQALLDQHFWIADCRILSISFCQLLNEKVLYGLALR